MRAVSRVFAIVLSQLVCLSVQADEVYLAVAANFSAPMQELGARFQQRTGHRLIVTFGASGKLFTQIRHGAPFQVFLSADQTTPAALEEAGFAVAGSRFTYATGTLVLWSSAPGSAQPGRIESNEQRLRDGDFHKLALANPKLAPYGAAALQVLDAMRLTAATRPKWVMGENIAQTYQFVHSGNAELGFVALSQVMKDGELSHGSGWVIPATLHDPIRQDAVLLQTAADHPAAHAWLDYLRSEEGRNIIHAYGYHKD